VESQNSTKFCLKPKRFIYVSFSGAGDGAEALAAYTRYRPDWVLMDIEMSQTDGITVTREILLSFPSAKVVIVTRHDDEQLREAARNAGACGADMF